MAADKDDAAIFRRVLDEARLRLGMTVLDVAISARVALRTLENWRAGKTSPGTNDLRKLADALHISPIDFFGEIMKGGDNHDEPRLLDRALLPLYGSVPAGPPVSVEQSKEVYPVLKHLAKANRYVLRVKGQSMLAGGIQDGDLILIEYVEDGELRRYDGQVCVVLVDGESTLKQIHVTGSGKALIVRLEGADGKVFDTFVLGHKPFEVQGVCLGICWRPTAHSSR